MLGNLVKSMTGQGGGDGEGMMLRRFKELAGQEQGQQGGMLGSPLMQRLMNQMQGGQQGPQAGGGGLAQQMAERLGGQAGQAPQAPAGTGPSMQTSMGGPQAGMNPAIQAAIEQFRQLYGRDPISQQELGMLNSPAVSQLMG